jgi:hypothetical protein
VREICSEINSEDVCETDGAVMRNGEVVKCVWDVIHDTNDSYGCFDLCEQHISYEMCSDDNCMWNNDSERDGICLSMNDEYLCSVLPGWLCVMDKEKTTSLIITDGPCFLNGIVDLKEEDVMCCSMSSVKECSDIGTNDAFDTNKRYCDNALDIFANFAKDEIRCMWIKDDNDSVKGKCIDFIENKCSDIKNIKNGSECGNHYSKKGKCFFNGDSQSGVNGDDWKELRCSDVEDVTECANILDFMLCAYATKDIYGNLLLDSSSSSSSIYCIWDVERGTCVTKNNFKGGLKCEEFGIEACDRMEGCAVIESIFVLFLPSLILFFYLCICFIFNCFIFNYFYFFFLLFCRFLFR